MRSRLLQLVHAWLAITMLSSCGVLLQPDFQGATVLPASAVSVTSPSSNATYIVGQSISIQVSFDAPVTVTGTPTLTLETGTSDAVVNYASGSGTNSLTFTYTVVSGHSASDLDYTSTAALTLNGGTILDANNLSVTLTLPSPGATGSLGANKNLVVDGVAPRVFNVTSSTANGTYKSGDSISIQVVFDDSVTVTGTPQLTLETGANDAVVNYASGSGTNTLNFTYNVAGGHTSGDLDYGSTTALSLNGGTIQDANGNNASLTLAAVGAAGSLGANKNLVIDGVAPAVTNVTSGTANGTYIIGQTPTISIVFDDVVTVTGTPQLTLETGSTDAVVSYTSGSGTNTLNFDYTVAAPHVSADLDYISTSALALNSGTIKDANGNNANLALPTPAGPGSLGANKNFVIDGVAPAVTNVTSSTANGTYIVGQSVSIQVVFDDVITVTGTPQLTLETGTNDAVVNYASGSGTNTLNFTYTVASTHTSADLEYNASNPLQLNGGTIKDASGNNASLTLPAVGGAGSLGANKDIVIDGVVPTVSNVTSSNADGTYYTGDLIVIQVVFTKTVYVTGTPQIAVPSGTANYSSGSGSVTLNFNYYPAGGVTTADLDYSGASSLTLNGGTIKDLSGNNATLTLAFPGTLGSLGANKNIVINSVSPTLAATQQGTVDSQSFGFSVAILGDVTGDGRDDYAVAGINTPAGGTNRGAVYVYSGADHSLFTTINGQEDQAHMGMIANAGDVNGDGYADLIIGEYGADAGGTDRGKVYVVDVAHANTVLFTINGTEDNATLGNTVAGAGDLNGDGKADFIAGAANSQGGGVNRGKVIVYSGADGSVMYTYNGAEDNARIGSVISGAGDVNGDGKPDFIIGSPNSSSGGSFRGMATVYSGADGSVLYTLNGTTNNANFGSGVSGAGDLDRDGKADFLIGESNGNGAGAANSSRGSVYVYSGATGTLMYRLDGPTDGYRLGAKVVSAGDVNGDGVPDILAGAPGSNSIGGFLAGQAYLFNGVDGSLMASFVGTESSAILGGNVAGGGDFNRDGKADFLISQNGAAAGGSLRGKVYAYTSGFTTLPSGSPMLAYTLTGTGTGSFGGDVYTVSGGGDVTGDGKPEFLIAEPFATPAGFGSGRAYVYSGATGTVRYSINGTQAFGVFGSQISNTGDINLDGKADFIIGERGYNAGGTARGRVVVMNGGAGSALYSINGTQDSAWFGFSVAGCGDVNRDGKPDFIVGEANAPGGGTARGNAYVYSGADGTVLYTINGTENNAQLGYTVAGAGDVNRDGKADFMVGEWKAAGGGIQRGKVYVYSGATGAVLYTITGSENNLQMGTAIAGAGDVNGDGYDDFIIGMKNADLAGTDRGQAVVYSGATGAALWTLSGTTDSYNFGHAVAGAGDVNRDGKADFLISEPQNPAGGTGRGKVYVYSGATGGLLHTVTGSTDNLYLGYSLSGAGDVNRDGKADFLIGAANSSVGQVFLYLAPSY